MELLGTPSGLVMFTGQRLWPQIDALAQWGDLVDEVHLVVVYGDDEPGGPADRLAAFVAEFFPQVKVRCHGPVNDDDPAAVLAQLAAILAAPGCWFLDASGGTRLMFAAALIAGERFASARVLHRDSTGPWYHLPAGGSARQLVGVDPKAVDRFTVEALLDVTWSDERRVARVVTAQVEPEIAAAAQSVVAGGDWRAPFETAVDQVYRRLGEGRPRVGFLFERFVLSLVRLLGVQADDVALSAVLFDGSRAMQEVDIVVNSDGRLHVIDCKLADEGQSVPIGIQIREAYATRRLLGDGADQFILLRPTISIEPEFKSLCNEYDIRVIDRDLLDRDTLADTLRRFIRPPLPESRAPFVPQRAVRLAVADGVIDLGAEFVQSRESARLYDHGNVLVLKVILKSTFDGPGVRDAVERVVAGSGEVLDVSQSANRNSVTITVRPFKRQRSEVLALLASLTSGSGA